MKAIDIDGREIETLEIKKDSEQAKPEVKVDDKPEDTQSPVPPAPPTQPDEKLHDEPDDDKNEKHLPAEEHPEAPDKPTPPAVKNG
jgi:hypothetical protein